MGPWYYLAIVFAFSVCSLYCSPTALRHAFNSPLSVEDLSSCYMGKTEAVRQTLLRLTIIQYTTTHIWAHSPYLLFNSVEGFLASLKASPCAWVIGPLDYGFPRTFLLQFLSSLCIFGSSLLWPPRILTLLQGFSCPSIPSSVKCGWNFWPSTKQQSMFVLWSVLWWSIVPVITVNYMRIYVAKTDWR